jgi:hypothetical protein
MMRREINRRRSVDWFVRFAWDFQENERILWDPGEYAELGSGDGALVPLELVLIDENGEHFFGHVFAPAAAKSRSPRLW